MPEHTGLVAAGSAADEGPRDPAAATGVVRPRRRRFVTEATDPRPLRVCRFARPAYTDGGAAYCRCGGAIEPTPQARTGYRHRPTRRARGLGL